MAYQLVNNYSVNLTGLLASGATVLPVLAAKATELATALGANYTTLAINDGTYVEIVQATATGSVITIARAQEGTTARAFAAGTCAKAQLTAAGLSYLICNSGCACVPIDMKAGLVIEQPNINKAWAHSWYFTGTKPFIATGITVPSWLTLDTSQLATGLLTVSGTPSTTTPAVLSIAVTGCNGSSEVINETLTICSPTGLGS